MGSAKVYKIVTDRLVIRCFELADAALLKKSIDESVEHLKPWMPWAWNEPEPIEKKIARITRYRAGFTEGDDYVFGIFNADESELIGCSGLHQRVEEGAREIGYWINVRYANKGIISEVVRAYTKLAFEIEGWNRLEIKAEVNNKASGRIPEKCGFIFKGIIKDADKDVHGSLADDQVWEFHQRDYIQSLYNDLPLKFYDADGKELEK